MKKTVILFVCILCAMSVWATDYKGTMVMNASSSNGGEEHVNKSDVVVSVEKNANGTYKVTLDDFFFFFKGVTYDVGTLEYDQLVGTTAADGYTYVNGTKQMGVSDIQGYEDLIPENLRKYFTNIGDKKFDVNFAGRFNDDMMIANINTEIKITASYYGATMTAFTETLSIDYVGNAIEPETTVGDVNGDNKVDVADVNAVINIILKTKQASDYPGNADINNDTKVDVADVNSIINIILKLT